VSTEAKISSRRSRADQKGAGGNEQKGRAPLKKKKNPGLASEESGETLVARNDCKEAECEAGKTNTVASPQRLRKGGEARKKRGGSGFSGA